MEGSYVALVVRALDIEGVKMSAGAIDTHLLGNEKKKKVHHKQPIQC